MLGMKYSDMQSDLERCEEGLPSSLLYDVTTTNLILLPVLGTCNTAPS